MRNKVAAIIALMIFLALVWLAYAGFRKVMPASVSINQRLSITVATPDGPRTGSAVTRLKAVPPSIIGGPTYSGGSWLRGEAVVVDLGQGRYLFALLGRPGAMASGLWRDDETLVAMIRRLRRHPPPAAEVPLDLMPMLVTFGDVSDPNTVTRVDPQDLAASFGPGVALSAVTLEVTRDPVTEGVVEGVLGWLEAIGLDLTLDGQRYSNINAHNRLANDLNRWNFVRP
jgi:hypothetical protein